MWNEKKNSAPEINYDNSLTNSARSDTSQTTRPFNPANSALNNTNLSTTDSQGSSETPSTARQPTSRELVASDSLASALQTEVPLPSNSTSSKTINIAGYVNLGNDDNSSLKSDKAASYLDMT